MKRYAKHLLRLALSTCLFTTAFAVNALADEEDRTKIDDISLDFYFDTDENEVYVDANGAGVNLDDFDITRGGNSPKVKVYLEADDDYYFSSKSSGIFNLSGEGARLSGTPSIRNDKSEMIVSVELRDVEGWNDIDEAYWQEGSAIAHWEDTGSSQYQVRLYRNGSAEGSVITVHNNVYNFNGAITRAGSYSFKVRVESGDEWTESDDLDVDAEDVSYYLNQSPEQPVFSNGPSAGGQWIPVGDLWWYRNADGTYTTNNWQLINNKWYFFDESGWMKVGWIPWNGKWYFCGADGAMLANTYTPDNLYWVGPDGAWIP